MFGRQKKHKHNWCDWDEVFYGELTKFIIDICGIRSCNEYYIGIRKLEHTAGLLPLKDHAVANKVLKIKQELLDRKNAEFMMIEKRKEWRRTITKDALPQSGNSCHYCSQCGHVVNCAEVVRT